jgi:predicted transcriptional regulator
MVGFMAMTLRPPEELTNELKALAEQERTSLHALWIKAAEEYVARRRKNVLIDDAMDWITVEYADALRRLGE